jgi:serine/threonine-protein kinase HipA
MSTCLICLRPHDGVGPYHTRCLRSLFGATHVPAPVDIDLVRLHTVGLAMVGRTTLSGVQRKISTNLSADRQTLQVALGPGRFILKPQASTFPELPENELVTMRLAELAGIDVPPCGLIELADGSMAYVVRRFDRLDSGRKLRQEDFCQLAALPPKRKYDGSAELCARLVRRYVAEPGIESLKLFRQMVFCWWTGNGDAHLKNFSLLSRPDGSVGLSPAYDLLCTRLVLPDDRLALPVGGKQDGLRRAHWEEYGNYCGLPARSIAGELARIAASLDRAVELVTRSPLGAPFRARYVELLRERAATFAAA